MKPSSVNRTLFIVSKLPHSVRNKTCSALVSQANPCSIRPALEWSFLSLLKCFLLRDSYTVRPYVTDGNMTFVEKSCHCFRGRYRMRRSKLNLDSKDVAILPSWSEQVRLISTGTLRSLSEVVHLIRLLPRRRAWMGPVKVDFRSMIIALHFHVCGTIRFLFHHSCSWARTLFSVFVNKSVVSEVQ